MKNLVWLVLLVPNFLLGGCLLDNIGSGKNVKSMDRTPDGWRVNWKDQGTLAQNRHTKAEIYALFDAAMTRASINYAIKYNATAHEYISKMKQIECGFTLRDDFMFPVPGRAVDFPDSAYASGMTQGPAIDLAFYPKRQSPNAGEIPVDVPYWTVRQGNSGIWYWGYEGLGDQFPALEYETFVNILGKSWL